MIAKLDGTKEFNRKLIFAQILNNVAVSRSDIVTNTGLSKAAVSSLVAEMLEQGLVQETGSQSTTIGRPRIMLELQTEARLALGAELTDHECRVILTDLRAAPLKEVTHPIKTTELTVEYLLDFLQACVTEILADVEQQKIIGMGLTIPAVVDPSTSTVLLSVLLPWRDVQLGEELERRFPFPVALFSRGNAATWGERWYGAGQDAYNLLYVRVGNGIVAGLVINGHPYLGQGFGAGELGHITVQPNGALCRCGNRGCLATVATTESLLIRVRRILREYPEDPLWQALNHHLESLTLDAVFQAARGGNVVVQQALDEIAAWLAIALASAVNLLNLDRIIVGGPMMIAGEALLEPLRTHLQQRALPTHLAHIDVVASALKENAPSIGAAGLILHEAMAPDPAALLSSTIRERIALFE
ncbi:MAG: ROK family transcriptional regulator [Caldilineaceae bacterium]|nr:ROK family transcriptional regulator [Caldilineaceae bacterium]